MEDSKSPVRRLVKARLMPWLYVVLATYAEQNHRTISSAAEHLISLGLRSEGYNVDSLNTQGDQSVTTPPESAGRSSPEGGKTAGQDVGLQGLEP